MVSRSEQLRGSRARRQWRLLGFCIGTALLLGTLAGVLAPKVLIGGILAGEGRATEAVALGPAVPGAPLPIAKRLGLDPREARGNAVRWNDLTEPERRALLERYWHLAQLTPDEQERFFDAYHSFRQLPQSDQSRLRDRARKLEAFMKTLSPQDLAMLKGMDDRQRAARLLELWRARYGSW